MTTPNRYSVILGNLGNTCDRFLPTGYKDQPPKDELLRRAAAIPGVQGVELVGSWDITEANADSIGAQLRELKLECVSIIPDLFSQKRWGRGSFSHVDAAIRRQALDETRSVARIARQLGCPLVNLWLGQDGYDYPLTADYRARRAWLTDGIATVAAEFPDLRFALEYKPKEPRTHSFQARAADTLLMALDTGLKNVGVCIDIGHGFVAGENVSESAVILQGHGERLFHLHCNDNFRAWDDDMIVGSLHFVEYAELLFWLREIGYTGWYSMDQYPYREDGAGAIAASVDFLRRLEALVEHHRPALRELVAADDAVRMHAWLRDVLFRR